MGTRKEADKPIFNRRMSRRSPSIFKVVIDGIAEHSANISREGVFIATESPHAIGDIVQFELSFPGLLAPMTLRGEVRFIAGPRDPEPGIGLRLLLDAAQAERIAQIADAAAEAAGPTGLSSDRQSSQPPALGEARRFRMLVCEDNPHAREMFVYGLRRLSKSSTALVIEIVESLNGQDGWQRLENNGPFDLVVTDVYMPVLGGAALIARMKETPMFAGIPTIAVSSSRDARAAALAAGADIFLPKPVQLRDILVTVRALLCLP